MLLWYYSGEIYLSHYGLHTQHVASHRFRYKELIGMLLLYLSVGLQWRPDGLIRIFTRRLSFVLGQRRKRWNFTVCRAPMDCNFLSHPTTLSSDDVILKDIKTKSLIYCGLNSFFTALNVLICVSLFLENEIWRSQWDFPD